MKNTQKDTNQRIEFLNVFKEIESFLRNNNNLPEGLPWFWDIRRYMTKHKKEWYSILLEYEEELYALKELRNSYSHEIFQTSLPSEWSIELLKVIRDELIKPKTVFEFLITENKKGVFTCNLKDTLKYVLNVMQEKLYTHVPIISNGKFVWLLSENSICEWLNKNIEHDWTVLIDKTLIEDLNIESENNNYLIVKRSTPLYYIFELFNQYVSNHDRLWAIFITNLWTKEESLDWIITAWDLPTIDEKIKID